MPLSDDILKRVTFLVGSSDTVSRIEDVTGIEPFGEEVTEFLNDVSRELLKSPAAKGYPDVVTFGFWLRKASVNKLKERFVTDGRIRLGKGFVFHIAPSNVPVNFAYSLAAGLMTGNANVVRVPSKDFPQVRIITDALSSVLERYEDLKPYVICVRYGRDSEINDAFSSVCDMRVVWGGDNTIAELRKSPLPPRSGEITFADRYSLAVIDSDSYMSAEDKDRIAQDFYNDTYLTDQNACTSPMIVVWTGSRISDSQEIFWGRLHTLVKEKYEFKPIQAVNKLTKSYLASCALDTGKISHEDNLLVRVEVNELTEKVIGYRDNSGFFFEYACSDIRELIPICNDKRCQTIGYIGDPSVLMPLIASKVKGIDRIVPVGRTMDFDLIWDGYDLPSVLTRTIAIE